MTRWKASAIHFGVSAAVLASIVTLLLTRWYPPGLIEMAKADRLILLITAIDLVVGPLLTLIVYKAGKKSLRFDLSCIALLQLLALAYGLHTVWQSRPVYLVGATDRFQLVFANDIDRADLKWAQPEFRRLPQLSVKTIGAALPDSAQEREQALFSAIAGKDLYLIPARYVPYSAVADQVVARSMPAQELVSRLAERDGERLKSVAERRGKLLEQLVAVPIDSVRGSATMLIDRSSKVPVAPVGVDPWAAFDARKAEQRQHKGRIAP